MVLFSIPRTFLLTVDITFITMAGGQGNNGKKRTQQQPNQLNLGEGTRSRTGSIEVKTNDSSPSDDHYELASDQMVSADNVHGTEDGGELVDSDSDHGTIEKGKEEDEVNPYSAFALDILGRKTGKKSDALTGFRNEMYQLDFRSDSEDGNESVDMDEGMNYEDDNGQSASTINKLRTKSLDRASTTVLKRHDKGGHSKTRDNGQHPDGGQESVVQVGPLDNRLRTAEEVRRALELAFQANKLARMNQYDEAVRLLTAAIAINENDYR